MCGCGRLDAGVLWVVWMAGLVEMDAEPPPQSESSMLPPLLQPAPQPFCNLPARRFISTVSLRPNLTDTQAVIGSCAFMTIFYKDHAVRHTAHLSQLLMSQV